MSKLPPKKVGVLHCVLFAQGKFMIADMCNCQVIKEMLRKYFEIKGFSYFIINPEYIRGLHVRGDDLRTKEKVFSPNLTCLKDIKESEGILSI
jgi:hypothetical protein